MTDPTFQARFSAETTALIRTAMSEPDRKLLHGAVEQASRDPWSWPQADRYDLDDSVREITLPGIIAHYVILPDPPVPHLWFLAVIVH
ncbi:hypothetical protein [Kitasatospora sp. NPDC057223]|uniref:hypothetical protein n=1 Tax=Kitasatospora sp. NPDC057223 TaxID=3346055 RepID=UPI003639AC1A